MRAALLTLVLLSTMLVSLADAEAAPRRKRRTAKKAVPTAPAQQPPEEAPLLTPLAPAAGVSPEAPRESRPEDFEMPPPPPLSSAPRGATSGDAVTVKQASTAAAAERSEPLGFDVALKVSMLVPTGNTSAASAAADSAAAAQKGAFAAGSLALRYALPFGERPLSLAVEAGFYRLSGEGTRGFANDPDYGPELRYAWKVDAIPVLAGLAYRLPFGGALSLSPTAGFAAVNVSSQSTYSAPDGSGQVTNAAQRAWALGFYAGAEAALALGPGSLVAEFRYMNARTDLDFVRLYPGAYNQSPGDVGGSQLLLGYRYSF